MRESAEIQQSPSVGEIEPRRTVTESLVHPSHLHTLLQNVGEGIVFLDASLCILYVNPAGAALLQRAADDLTGTALSSILREGKKDPLIRALAALASREGVGTERLVYPYGDQTFHLTLMPVRPDSQDAGYLVLIRDGSSPVRRIDELTALNELGGVLASTLDPRKLYRLIMDWIQDLMGVEASSLLLKDEQTDELVFQIGLGHQGASVQGRRLRVDQGIAGWVFQHGWPLLVPDVREDNRFYRRMDEETGFQTKSVLCVPLKTQDKVIGVIQVLNRPTDRAFTEEDLNLLSTIAAHASTAIENARLFQETQARAKKLRALAEVSRALTATLDLQQVSELIVGVSSKLLNAPVTSLWTLEGNTLVLRKGVGLNSELSNQHDRLIGELAEWIASQKQPVVINELNTDQRVKEQTVLSADGLYACAGFPLRVKQRSLGVLMVVRTIAQAFHSDEVELLATFANQAAVAVDHASLYQQLRAYSANLERTGRERTEEFHRKIHNLEHAYYGSSKVIDTLCDTLQVSLSSVIGFTETLHTQKFGSLTGKQVECVDSILHRSKDLIALINTVQTLSELEEGTLTLHPETLQVSEMLLAVLGEIVPQGEAKGVQFSVDFKGCRAPVVADPRRLKQILYNLLSNAVRYTPDGGLVTLKARSDEATIEISVTDEGRGIKEEHLVQLFQPLKQQRGMGIGLALAKELVELHGGRIWAESEGAGKGATFTFALPLRGPATP